MWGVEVVIGNERISTVSVRYRFAGFKSLYLMYNSYSKFIFFKSQWLPYTPPALLFNP